MGLPVVDRSRYDEYMLYLHRWMMENDYFQRNCVKEKLSFLPGSAWLVFGDGLPHAVLSGQFALEQTFLVKVDALVRPEIAPVHVLESITRMKMTA